MHKTIPLYVAFITAAGVAGGCAQNQRGGPGDAAQRIIAASGARQLPDFVALAKQLQPLVVNVSTMRVIQQTSPGALPEPKNPQNSPLGHLPEQHFGVQPQPGLVRQNLASGVIIKADGHIVTNAHVVENAEKIIVKLADRREFEASVVGKDPHTDIAIIKINAKDALPAAELGDSDRLQVGEWVMAVGSPFGLDSSITSGIVSAKGRHIGAGPYDSFIQTDASINPGNSGGPLVDLRGKVVGINMAIVSQTGGNIGIGFAMPINLIKELLPQLETQGKVIRGWAGLAVQDMTATIAQKLGLDRPRGALVARIVEGGPAERGGIKVGDIITEFDGQEVKDAGDFPLMVARTPIEKKVAVKVVRESAELEVAVTIAELSDEAPETEPTIG